MRRLCDENEVPFPDIEYPVGGILGTVGLYGSIYINTDDEIDGYDTYPEEWLRWWDREFDGWVLKKPKPSPFIPISGMLGLWGIPPDIEKMLQKAEKQFDEKDA